jgi:hypothetical protein
MSAALRVTHPCRVGPHHNAEPALLDTPRSLRVSTAAAGIGVEVVSKRLGHARISVTHPDDEQQREAADTFRRLLADGGGTWMLAERLTPA